MHNTLKSTLYGFLLLLSACSGEGETEPTSVLDSDSGDALDSGEYSPTRNTDKGVARFNSDSNSDSNSDAEVEAQDGEVIDAGELGRPDAEVEAQDGEVIDAGDCNPIGRWQVYINPQIICFRLNGPEVSFIDVESASGCHADLEISLDINEPESLYGRFLGTITYHVTFTGDTLTGNAEIVGIVTNGAGSMDCETTAFITGVRL